MGCIHSREREDDHDDHKLESENEKITLELSKGEFQVKASHFQKASKSHFIREYEEQDLLGSGNAMNPLIYHEGFHGTVKKVTHRTTKAQRASKMIKKESLDPETEKMLLNEVKILNSLDHPNILRVFEIFNERTRYYIISEYLAGEDLYERIQNTEIFTEVEAAKILRQILAAVAYCHRNGIVHRDIKTENLIYDSKSKNAILKLIDFGSAVPIKPNKKLKTTVGTPYYIAPEVIKGEYNEKCDVWSCGVILYILLGGGIPPFYAKDNDKILAKVTKGEYNFNDPSWKKVSEEGKSLVKKMLEYDPEKRISAQDALNDSWFEKTIEKVTVDVQSAKTSLKRLKSAKYHSKLQETTLVFLVNYFSTKEEREKLLETFNQLDTDNSGQLSREELINGYMNIMHMTKEEAENEANTILKNLDNNNDDFVDYSDFVTATICKKTLLTRERLEAAFKLFDKDGSGKIDAGELKKLFDEENFKHVPQDIWESWIKEVDGNGDGAIDIHEFHDMMMKIVDEIQD